MTCATCTPSPALSFEVIWHSFWHILRWGLAGDIRLVWQHGTGISGLISLLLTPLIAWPMLFPRLRKGIRFEVRKALHYLSIVWAVSICFHAPKRHIAIIMGLSVGLYAVDWLYGYFFKVYHAETLRFTRIGNAVEVVWEHPQGFESKGAGLHQPALDHARGVARLLARLAPLMEAVIR